MQIWHNKASWSDMKLLIFSDSHGAAEQMKSIILQHRGSLHYIIHAGDLLHDADVLREFVRLNGMEDCEVIAVPGNGDYIRRGADVKSEAEIEIGGKKIYILHGHQRNVRVDHMRDSHPNGGESLKKYDLVIFGHTHIPEEFYFGSTVYFNPGSISRPRSSAGKTYGIITIEDGKIKTEIKKI